MSPDDTTTDTTQQAAAETQSPNAQSDLSASSAEANTASNTSGDTASTNISDGNADPAKATPGEAISEINPSNALAGTSGKLAGTNNTGMAAGSGVEKVAPVKATAQGDNAGVDAAPGVNVKVPTNAPHPLEALTLGKTGDLRQWIDTLEQSVVVIRMKQDLENLEGWIKQHFADLKRKV